MTSPRFVDGRPALAARCYRILLLAYPPAVRRRFGHEMLQTFRASWQDARIDDRMFVGTDV